MKKWNTPSVEELDVKETANGYLTSNHEWSFILNDNLNDKSNTTEDKKEDVVS